MRLDRRRLLVALLVVTAWWGAVKLREGIEIATLEVRGRTEDYYTRLWVVDVPPDVWIRAERPERLWLKAIRYEPRVVLRRGGRDLPMRAVVWDGGTSRDDIDRLFRAKYGWLDPIAALFWRRDSVPVRLEPR